MREDEQLLEEELNQDSYINEGQNVYPQDNTAENEPTNQQNGQNSALKQATDYATNMAKQKIQKEVSAQAKKATGKATKKVAELGAKATKAAVEAGTKLLAKLVALLGPYLPWIIGGIILIVLAVAFWGNIVEVVENIKNAFSTVIENVVDFFTLDGNTYTISEDQLDKIIKNLEEGENGIKLKDYNLDKEDIKSFLEANLITQSVDGYNIGNKKGAIQVWMTNPEDVSEGLTGSKKLEFVNYDNFQAEIVSKDSACLSHYTVDKSNNIIVATQNRHIVVEDGTTVEDEITYTTKSFGYKTVIAQYNMPIMFFIDTAMITSNKYYVLDLADQTKDTQIVITMQDTMSHTYTKSTREVTNTHTDEEGNTSEETETIKVETTDITHNLTPTITKADTLLYTKEMIYVNSVKTESTDTSTTTKNEYKPGIEKDPYIKMKEFEETAKSYVYISKVPGDSMVYPRDEAYHSLITGGDMLFELMDENVQNETIVTVLKYILYKLSGYDFGVTQLDNSIFDFSDFSSFDLVEGGVEYSSLTITEKDIEALCKITSAERGNGTQEQQEFVVSVILNRALCKNISIIAVIEEPGQFTPVSNGTYQKAVPSEVTKAAVQNVIQNGDTTGGATYFCTPAASKREGSWYKKSIDKGVLTFLFNDEGGSTKGHNFYSEAGDLAKLAQFKRKTIGGNSTVLKKAEELWQIVCNSGKYTKYGGSSIPCNGPTIDCSAFVSWVLYECGYQEFAGWQHDTSSFYNTNWTATHSDWEQIPVASRQSPIDILQPGDIFVRRGEGTHHVLIVAYIKDGRLYAYDCGSTKASWNSMGGKPIDNTGFLSARGPGKIIRIKSSTKGIVNPNGKYLVAIDAGHGEKAPSSYYTTGTAATYNGVYYTEWEWNRQVADRAVEILSENKDISIIRIGNSEENPKLPNKDRVPMAVEAGVDLYVSIHFNSVDNSSTNGTYVFVTKGDSKSAEFGEVMANEISKSLGTVNKGVSSNQTWTIIKNSKDTGFPRSYSRRTIYE